ncbi:hypothetical protein PVAND_011729 [Polypedilum vanderplanki]|uniref:ABC transporter domain-containing protein n=1 Tax=Polypedilum vanderplanki TaxID=319348 RepID=A0A9J6CK88_POLVA|nr:hypothetical protein PVAND_011729 [Polypedilum vanderplanki]
MDIISTYKVFIVKTLKEKKYYWARNAFFMIFPLLFIILFLFSVTANDNTNATDSHTYSPQNEEELFSSIPSGINDHIYFVPNDTFYSDLMEKFRIKVEIEDERVNGFQSENDIWNKIGDISSRSFIILFNKNSNTTFQYTIKSKNNRFQSDQQYSKNLNAISSKVTNEYVNYGFLGIQYALDVTYIEHMIKSKETPHVIQIERLPSLGNVPKSSIIESIGLFIVIFSALICIALIFTRMVEEKSCGFREQLKNATPYSSLNNVALFTVNLLQMLSLFFICLVITYNKGVWMNVNFFYPLTLVILYITGIIAFTLLVSAFFESIAFSTVGALFWYFVPFFCFQLATVQWKKILIIFPINSFYQGILIFHDYTNSGHYFSHVNFNQRKLHPNDGIFSMSDIYLWLFISTILCISLYFYIINVCPGQYGIKQNPLFIFQRSYYIPNKIDIQSEVQPLNFTASGFENFQHLNQNTVVRIRNLTKTYKSCFNNANTVVKNISMDIYKNQITVLLGHNGAGKTTTMCMLTGLITKTSGHIYVDNIDNIQFYRSKIGFCPQHNIFLSYLTCHEHLVFFGQLRGLSKTNAEIEATNILKKVNLHSKAHEVAKRLSGGMLRKLSLANAIIGETKLLVLDEISSGVDLESRRDIWNILLKLKKDHTILLTTHYMEEADTLADKIAIMESGELIAYGTSMFLKHHYGSGYTLKMLKNTNDNKFDRTSVHNTIKRHIPSAEQKCSVDPLYCMTLPYKDKHKYAEMLRELEVNKALYGIESLSITNTTLEEVFLNSGVSSCVQDGKIDDTDEIDNSYSAIEIHDRNNINRKLIYFRQFQAIFYKKFIYWIRNLPFFCAMVAIPIVMTFLCFLLNTYLADKKHAVLPLKINNLQDPLIMVNFRSNGFSELENTIMKYSQQEDVKIEILRDKNIEQEILDVADGNVLRYYDNLLGAVNFEKSLNGKILVNIFYSQNLIHSVSIMLNFVDNIMLKRQLPNNMIEVINSPLNRQDENLNYIQNLYTEFVPIGLMLYMIMYLPFTFKEKISGFKNLQNIISIIYWSALFLSDLLVHTVVIIIIMLITSYDRKGLDFIDDELEMIAILFLVYGATCLIIVYITSQCFSNLSSSIMFLNYLQIFSLFGIIIMSNSKESMKEYESSITFFHIFPDFALKHSLKVIHEHHKFERNHEKVGNSRDSEVYTNSFYEYQHIFDLTQFFIANAMIFVIASLFLFYFIENQRIMEQFGFLCSRLQMCWCFGRNKNEKNIENIQMDEIYDPDVSNEKKNVSEIIREEKTEQEAMIVSEITKIYEGNVKAVQDVSFSVKKGECFGLLGANGSGKTSLFEIMTLNRSKTCGRVFINGVNSDQDKFLYRYMYGYCPQQDALCDYMTSRELLKYMLMINGYNSYDLDLQVEKWLRKVDIEKYRDKRISNYSGGTKRKLNTAMAMITDPFIIFLDEPTSGVDPKSRKFVWNCIKSLQCHQKTIVLTSHSMDECEMLCNRLGIMKNGELKCIGYIQKLKEKFGKGFSLMVKMKPKVPLENDLLLEVAQDLTDSSPSLIESITDIKLQLQSLFTCDLKDEHEGVLQYFIHAKHISWAKVFQDLLEFSNDHENVIDSFAINETTLEDIFQQFRNEQINQ